ncbi:hypothetical protein NDI52_32910, partial [Leptolyngbya sp. PL-A3]
NVFRIRVIWFMRVSWMNVVILMKPSPTQSLQAFVRYLGALYVLVAVLWLIPDRRIEKALNS